MQFSSFKQWQEATFKSNRISRHMPSLKITPFGDAVQLYIIDNLLQQMPNNFFSFFFHQLLHWTLLPMVLPVVLHLVEDRKSFFFFPQQTFLSCVSRMICMSMTNKQVWQRSETSRSYIFIFIFYHHFKINIKGLSGTLVVLCMPVGGYDQLCCGPPKA